MQNTPPDTQPEKPIARDEVIHAIKLLETHLRYKGYIVPIGAELEYYCKPRTKNEYTATLTERGEARLVPIEFRGNFENLHGFENSLIISRHYMESMNELRSEPHHYELVFSHEPRKHADGKGEMIAESLASGKGSKALRLARAIEAAKKMVFRESEKRGYDANFEAKHDDMLNGLHINVSVVKQDGDLLLKTAPQKDFLGNDTNALHHSSKTFAAHLIPTLKETFALITPTIASLDRYGHRPTSKAFAAAKTTGIDYNKAVLVKEKEGKAYIENRLPGADADPYLAILSTLVAVDDALEHIHKPTLGEKIHDWLPHENDMIVHGERGYANATGYLQNGRVLRECLNRLETGLGDKIADAVLVARTSLSLHKNRPTSLGL